MSKKMQSNILLLITAMVWGGGFVAQKAGAMLQPFTYTGIRTMIAAVAVIPVIMAFDKINAKEKAKEPPKSEAELKAEKKTLILGGVATGLVLCVAANLQQTGIYFDTDAGKAGFITALYIVLVPILGIFMGKKVRPVIWFCVLLGAFGFYLLCMAGHPGADLSLKLGDLFCLLCAIGYSFHIITIDHFSPKCDGMKMSCIQFFVAGGLSCIIMFIFETPKMADIIACAGPLLYAGVISAGVGFTLQILGQKHAEPTVASLIMSLESVFAVIFGVLLLHESLTIFEGLGCIVIFAAVIISQLPSKEERLATKNQQ